MIVQDELNSLLPLKMHTKTLTFSLLVSIMCHYVWGKTTNMRIDWMDDRAYKTYNTGCSIKHSFITIG